MYKHKIDTTRLVELIYEKNLTKADMANFLKTSPQNFSFKLNGTNRLNIYEVKIICEKLNIDTGDVFKYFEIPD